MAGDKPAPFLAQWNKATCCQDWGVPGDANADGLVDLQDILFQIAYRYEEPQNFPSNSIDCDQLIDATGDGKINLLDILVLITYLYDPVPSHTPVCPD